MTDFISLLECGSKKKARQPHSDMDATRRRVGGARKQKYELIILTFHLPRQRPRGLLGKGVSSGERGSRAS